MDYKLINKTLFFPEEKILVIGDLHLGCELGLREPDSLIPSTYFTQIKNDLELIFKEINAKHGKIKKIILLGDIKHIFSFVKPEKNLFLDLLLILTKQVTRENIITLKGNHEKITKLADKKLLPYYIEKTTAFIHGDTLQKKILNPKIKTIVMGHLHPAITLVDSQNIKKEKYKIFLIGKYKQKQIIILPSFIPGVEGTSVNYSLTDSHCIIPVNTLKKFKAFVIGKGEIFNFGELKKLEIN